MPGPPLLLPPAYWPDMISADCSHLSEVVGQSSSAAVLLESWRKSCLAPVRVPSLIGLWKLAPDHGLSQQVGRDKLQVESIAYGRILLRIRVGHRGTRRRGSEFDRSYGQGDAAAVGGQGSGKHDIPAAGVSGEGRALTSVEGLLGGPIGPNDHLGVMYIPLAGEWPDAAGWSVCLGTATHAEG